MTTTTTVVASGWTAIIDVSIPFNDDTLSLVEKGAQIQALLMAAYPDDLDLDNLTDELVDAAREDDESYFDRVWDAIYDWADGHRVFIDAHPKGVPS